jgi:SAM-dependent methyltransferase
MSGYWGRRISNPHFYVIRDDITNPRIAKRFGVITCLSTLEHISDHRTAILGMASLLKPGGILILSHPYNEERYVPNAYDLPEALGYVDDPEYVCQVFNRATVDGWLREAGLQLAQQRYWRVFTGEFWGCGNYAQPRQEVGLGEPHHLTGIVLKKASSSH